jgi:hypothetical protein
VVERALFAVALTIVKCSLLSLACAVAAIVATATPVVANDLNDACHAFASAEVIFIGRVKSAPTMRHVSGEAEVEKARALKEAAERDFKAYEALNMSPEIGGGRLRDLVVRMVEARNEYNAARAKHPPPVDLPVTPMLVETAYRGVTTPELFMWNKGQPELDPARSYLFYAERPMGELAPDVIFAGFPKELETADADVRFLNDVVASDGGTVVHGSLTLDDPDERHKQTPLGGVVLRIVLDGQRYEAATGPDGTFLVTGVPPGLLRIEPVLPEHLTLPPRPTGVKVSGGCLELNMRATYNGRIRGRVLLDSGEPFRGFVDLVRHGHQRYLHSADTSTNERGEFAFSAVPPGDYLLGINTSRQPSSHTPFGATYFPGTTERSSAVPVTVGHGTEHPGLDWVVSERLREGAIEVTFDTHGQPQKDMGVCVRMYDNESRPSGGSGYSGEKIVVPVIEGFKYRFLAHAQTPAGLAKSDVFDFIGTPGHQSVRLAVASVTQTATGRLCAVENPKPFSPSR